MYRFFHIALLGFATLFLNPLTGGHALPQDQESWHPVAAIASIDETQKSNGPEPTMLLPRNFREWVFLTSGFAMTYDPNAGATANPQFENVFVNPAAYRAYLKAGTWPEKKVLVLESRMSDSKLSINKNGRVQTNVASIEVHSKDVARGGWAFYSFDRGAQRGALLPYTEDCYSCHEQHGAVDTTFVQFYPTLIAIAKRKGTFKQTP